jgi:hypothetical protein
MTEPKAWRKLIWIRLIREHFCRYFKVNFQIMHSHVTIPQLIAIVKLPATIRKPSPIATDFGAETGPLAYSVPAVIAEFMLT